MDHPRPIICGTWNNPAQNRCNRKFGYPSLRAAEARAAKDSIKTGELILAYECFDCGRFHVGHADKAQLLVRAQQLAQSMCIICGAEIPKARREAIGKQKTRYCSPQCAKRAERRRRNQRLKAAREAENKGLAENAK